MADEFKRAFPLVYSFEGRPSPDGSAFLVEGTSFDGDTVRFAMPVDNIQHFIAGVEVNVATVSAAMGAGRAVGISAAGRSRLRWKPSRNR
jgi:hypothetical protein